MKRAGIIVHPTRRHAAEGARWLSNALARRGIEVHALAEDDAPMAAEVTPAASDFPAGMDLLFVLGGDGTFLRAAALAAETGVPLLGINFGRLGFLAALERGELETALEDIVTGGFEVEERMVIEAEIETEPVKPVWALNDVIIGKAAIGRAIKLAVAIDGEPVVAVAADGLIIATPTGSTAYSFSAHGPIISPKIDCLLISAVSPHDLFDRSLIAAPSEEVTVRVLADVDAAALSADGGPGIDLPSGTEVRLRAAERRLRLAKVSQSPFWRLVRQKLRLPLEPQKAPGVVEEEA